MNFLSIISEKLKATLLFNGKTTGTADAKGLLPVGSNGVTFLCLVTMGNAANLVLSIVSADDADGTTPVAITENIPIFLDNVAQTAAKTHTISDDTGSFVVSFHVPAALIPTGKYICISFADSNAANILSVAALNDVYQESGT